MAPVQTVPKTRDTKERILDAAERRFSLHGFAGTSLRAITREAQVNLAAVNYHFGSKEALVEAVFTRRLKPLNRERLDQLSAARKAGGDNGPSLESIVEAFVGPVLRNSRDPDRGGMAFMRLLGHAMNQPQASILLMLAEQFRDLAESFARALHEALPELPREEVLWRVIFMAGSMAHTMCLSEDIDQLTDGQCRGDDADEVIARLVPFLASALRAPAEVG